MQLWKSKKGLKRTENAVELKNAIIRLYFSSTACVELNNLCDYFHAGNFLCAFTLRFPLSVCMHSQPVLLARQPVSFSKVIVFTNNLSTFSVCAFFSLRKVENASHSTQHNISTRNYQFSSEDFLLCVISPKFLFYFLSQLFRLSAGLCCCFFSCAWLR